MCTELSFELGQVGNLNYKMGNQATEHMTCFHIKIQFFPYLGSVNSPKIVKNPGK